MQERQKARGGDSKGPLGDGEESQGKEGDGADVYIGHLINGNQVFEGKRKGVFIDTSGDRCIGDGHNVAGSTGGGCGTGEVGIWE